MNIDKFIYDHAVWVYFITAVSALYGFLLFAWWWVKQGKATTVYKYVMLYLLGSFTTFSISMFSRYHLLVHDSHEVLESWYWPFRLYPMVLAIVALVVHMTYRVIVGSSNHNGNHPRRRKTDL